MAFGKRKPFNTKDRKRRKLWQRIGFGTVILIVVGGIYPLVFYSVRLPALTTTTIEVVGTETVSKDEVRMRAEELLRGTYFGFVPRRFSLALPTDEIVESIRTIPRVSDAFLSTEKNTLIIQVREYIPDMLWCANSTATSTCFYVDKNGGAYEKAPQLAGSTFMRFIVSDVEPKVGDSLLTDTSRSLLVAIAKIIEERHEFHVSRIEYTKDSDAVLYLSGGGRLLVSTEGNLEEMYANLASVLLSDEYSSLTPGNFEYIDLRFGNKVFVQKEKPIATTTVSSTTPVE